MIIIPNPNENLDCLDIGEFDFHLIEVSVDLHSIEIEEVEVHHIDIGEVNACKDKI